MKLISCTLLSLFLLVACADRTPETPSDVALDFAERIYKDQSINEALKHCDESLKAIYEESKAKYPQEFADAMSLAKQFEENGLTWTVTKEDIKLGDRIVNGVSIGAHATVSVDFKLTKEIVATETAMYENAPKNVRKILENIKWSEWQTIYKMKQIDGRWVVYNLRTNSPIQL